MYGSDLTLPQEIGKRCVRDLEKEAKMAKKILDSTKEYHKAMKKFTHSPVFYRHLQERQEQRAFFALYGDLSMAIPSLKKKYAAILEELEGNDQKKGKN